MLKQPAITTANQTAGFHNHGRTSLRYLVASGVAVPLALLIGHLFPDLHPNQAVALAQHGWTADKLAEIIHSRDLNIAEFMQKVQNYIAAGAKQQFGFRDDTYINNPALAEVCTLLPPAAPEELPIVSPNSCKLTDKTDSSSILNRELRLADLYDLPDTDFHAYTAQFLFDQPISAQVNLQFTDSADIHFQVDRVTVSAMLFLLHTARDSAKEPFSVSLHGTNTETGDRMEVVVYYTLPFHSFVSEYSVKGYPGNQEFSSPAMEIIVSDVLKSLPLSDAARTVLAPLQEFLDTPAEG